MTLTSFTKMQSLGNDFVIFNGVSTDITLSAEQIQQLAHRHSGIGCDQLFILEPPRDPEVDFWVKLYNADGRPAGQCGNGMRCLAQYVLAKGLCRSKTLSFQTDSSLVQASIEADSITVNMGMPIFEPPLIPYQQAQAGCIGELTTPQGKFDAVVLSMGNPHLVLAVDELANLDIRAIGTAMNQHADFPEGVNVGCMQQIDHDTLLLRVFERGVGETLACGSGACAAFVAANMLGLIKSSKGTVAQAGGPLTIGWTQGSPVMMTGTATHVFEGSIDL